MAHNIDQSTGKAAFFSVKEPAWHGLGIVVKEAVTSRQAIELAGLNYEVGLAPIYADIKGVLEDDGYNDERLDKSDIKPIADKYATYRKDTGATFGVVGGRYEVVQNTEAFEFFDAFAGNKAAIFDTAGALHGGAVIFISAKVPGECVIGRNDVIDKYLLLTSSHDGSGAIKVLFTPTRVVCANTLAVALKSSRHSVSIRHTKNADVALKKAHELLGLTAKVYDNFGNLGNQLANTRISDKQLSDYIETIVLGAPKEQLREKIRLDYKGNNSAELAKLIDEAVSTRKTNIINSILEYAHIGLGQELDTAKGTAWGAYNSITGYFQNVKKYKNPEHKMDTLILGSDYDTMQVALDLAVNLAK